LWRLGERASGIGVVQHLCRSVPIPASSRKAALLSLNPIEPTVVAFSPTRILAAIPFATEGLVRGRLAPRTSSPPPGRPEFLLQLPCGGPSFLLGPGRL